MIEMIATQINFQTVTSLLPALKKVCSALFETNLNVLNILFKCIVIVSRVYQRKIVQEIVHTYLNLFEMV